MVMKVKGPISSIRTVSLLAALIAATYALTGCVYERSEEAAHAKTALVGMTRASIEGCMGTPSESRTDGLSLTLTYGSGRKPDEKLFCKVDIEIRQGLVSRVSYRGWTGGLLSQDEQCAPLVEKCLPARPPGTAEKLENLLHF